MDETPQVPAAAPAAPTEVIREVCQQNLTEPGAIWDALEAKGVETTPGVIYQTLTATEPAAEARPAPTAPTEASQGLTAEDMAALGSLAVKAGGVEQIIRILSVWQAPTT